MIILEKVVRTDEVQGHWRRASMVSMVKKKEGRYTGTVTNQSECIYENIPKQCL